MLVRRTLRKHVAPGAVEVDEAENGEAALTLLAQRRYDVVLADYRMGSVTGVDVLAGALEAAPATVRILMTGFADPAVRKGAETRAKVHAFFEKPVSAAEFESLVLERVVREHLGA